MMMMMMMRWPMTERVAFRDARDVRARSEEHIYMRCVFSWILVCNLSARGVCRSVIIGSYMFNRFPVASPISDQETGPGQDVLSRGAAGCTHSLPI